jgi:hypothetical protein
MRRSPEALVCFSNTKQSQLCVGYVAYVIPGYENLAGSRNFMGSSNRAD